MSEGGTFSLCANTERAWIHQSSFSDSPRWRQAAQIIEEAAAHALGAKPSRGGTGSTRWALPGAWPLKLSAVLAFYRLALAGLRAQGLTPDFGLHAMDIVDWPSAAYVEDIPYGQARASLISDGHGILLDVHHLLVGKPATPKAVIVEPAEPEDPALAGLSEELDAASGPAVGLARTIDQLRAELDDNQISDAQAAMKLAEAVTKHGATFRRSVFEQMVSGIRRGS
jgi:hypothetical protein